MDLRIVPRTLKLAETFTIAYASSDEEPVVGVELHHAGLRRIRRGDAVRPLRRDAGDGDRLARARARRCSATTRSRSRRSTSGSSAVPGQQAARAAVDAALHDLIGKVCGQPMWRIFGLTRTTPETTYTIGIDTVEGTADRARRAVEAGYRRLKIKVGGADDLPRLRAVKSVTDVPRARRRERGLGSRVGARAAAAARAHGRRADRAAVPRGRPRQLPQARAASSTASRS